mmetsp:Transcript_14740/g.36757  ORF Transcript_14740/g.36757 Transcript_14740/m.36757 type:complete len:308 (-) Transcript_14740:2068-2991(-)
MLLLLVLRSGIRPFRSRILRVLILVLLRVFVLFALLAVDEANLDVVHVVHLVQVQRALGRLLLHSDHVLHSLDPLQQRLRGVLPNETLDEFPRLLPVHGRVVPGVRVRQKIVATLVHVIRVYELYPAWVVVFHVHTVARDRPRAVTEAARQNSVLCDLHTTNRVAHRARLQQCDFCGKWAPPVAGFVGLHVMVPECVAVRRPHRKSSTAHLVVFGLVFEVLGPHRAVGQCLLNAVREVLRLLLEPYQVDAKERRHAHHRAHGIDSRSTRQPPHGPRVELQQRIDFIDVHAFEFMELVVDNALPEKVL